MTRGQELIRLLYPLPGGTAAMARWLGITQRHAQRLYSGDRSLTRRQLYRLKERADRVLAGEARGALIAAAERAAAAEMQRASECVRLIEFMRGMELRGGSIRKSEAGRPRKPSVIRPSVEPQWLKPGEVES